MKKDPKVEFFENIPTAFITDAFRRLGIGGWINGVTPITTKAKHIAGKAVTVKYSYKRAPKMSAGTLYSIIRECSTDEALVLGGQGTSSWLLGENTVHAALYQGMAGIVVDGCIRDTEEISKMSIPVLCKGPGVSPPPLKRVHYKTTIFCGKTQVSTNDYIVGDNDGTVVIPNHISDEIVKQVKDIREWEKKQAELIAQKSPLEDLHSLLDKKHQLKR